MAWGLLGIESRLQLLKQIGLTREEAFRLFMDYTHWRVDARLVSAFIRKSASTIDWLENLGVKFIDVQSHNQGLKFTWHIIDGPLEPPEIPATGFVAMKAIAEKAQQLGARFCYRTPAKKLIKENGRITGVLAEDEQSGEEVAVKAEAVIVATGGCADNPAMVKKYTGMDLQHAAVAGVTGDGIRMAWEAGAMPTDIVMHGGYGSIEGVRAQLHLAISFMQPNLIVNLFAERFMNEVIRQKTPFGSNPFNLQKDRTAFGIFDEDTKNYYVEQGLDFPMGILFAEPIIKVTKFDEQFQQAMDEGVTSIFKANSIEEIAAGTGLDKDKLTETVNEYNRACDTGRDDVFYKPARYLRPVRKPPFYVSKMTGAHSLGSLGGIKINYKTEVVGKDYEVIPGLYAAGLDANSIYGDTYIFWLPGNTFGFAVNSGRMAGENAAEYVKSGK
jgi:fumarate reductase flavoprotein subunit